MPPGRVLLVVASVVAFALTLRSMLGPPLPLWVSLSAFIGYGGVVTWGVLNPSWEMFAEVVWRGPEGAKGVVLTFDDGPHPVFTRRVLDALDLAGAKATFFVIGTKAAAHPDLVREIAARGHLVGVHGDTHDRLLSLRSAARVRHDLTRAIERLTKITGEIPRFYRPPVGQTNPPIAKIASELGLTIVGWSVRARDGIATNAKQVIERVVPRLEDGAIVLMHDAAEKDDREPSGPRALPAVLTAMRERGFAAVRLDTWIGDSAMSNGATNGELPALEKRAPALASVECGTTDGTEGGPPRHS